MSDVQDIPARIEDVSGLLGDKLGARGRDLSTALRKAKPRLPRRIHAQAQKLAQAETLAAHPRLRMTLDAEALDKAAHEVTTHLNAIDLADRRKGWWLGMAGGMAFNLLLFAALLIVGLRYFGLI